MSRLTKVALSTARRAGALALALAAVPALGLSAGGCEAYEGAPRAIIANADKGILADRKVPLVVEFDKPVVLGTVKLKVVRLIANAEGDLGDEDTDPETALDMLVDFDGTAPDDAVGGTVEQSADGRRLTVKPEKSFPVAEKLAVLLEPGLSDGLGHDSIVRERLPFSYDVKLTCTAAPDFPSGAYFFLADVKKPIGVQVQLLAWLEVNQETGNFIGRFVNADRNKDPSRCAPAGLMCDDSEACRTLPAPACVAPSEKAASVDEYPDYVTNYELPTGYAFDVRGCIDGTDPAKMVFVNIPVDVEVQSPHVFLIATALAAVFGEDDKGVLRGAGSIATDQVILGTADSGKAEGLISARLIPDAEIPKDLQKPDVKP